VERLPWEPRPNLCAVAGFSFGVRKPPVHLLNFGLQDFGMLIASILTLRPSEGRAEGGLRSGRPLAPTHRSSGHRRRRYRCARARRTAGICPPNQCAGIKFAHRSHHRQEFPQTSMAANPSRGFCRAMLEERSSLDIDHGRG
jgi:hypothetical protein